MATKQVTSDEVTVEGECNSWEGDFTLIYELCDKCKMPFKFRLCGSCKTCCLKYVGNGSDKPGNWGKRRGKAWSSLEKSNLWSIRFDLVGQ